MQFTVYRKDGQTGQSLEPITIEADSQQEAIDKAAAPDAQVESAVPQADLASQTNTAKTHGWRLISQIVVAIWMVVVIGLLLKIDSRSAEQQRRIARPVQTEYSVVDPSYDEVGDMDDELLAIRSNLSGLESAVSDMKHAIDSIESEMTSSESDVKQPDRTVDQTEP